MAKKAQLGISPEMWALYILLMILFFSGGLLAWNYDWSKFKLNLGDSNFDLTYENPEAKCPKTLAEMGKTCCEPTESGKMQAAVGAVYISGSCKQCPIGTHFLQMAPEGNYKICECDACPN